MRASPFGAISKWELALPGRPVSVCDTRMSSGAQAADPSASGAPAGTAAAGMSASSASRLTMLSRRWSLTPVPTRRSGLRGVRHARATRRESGFSQVLGQRQVVRAQERQLVPVAALKCDPPVHHMEEPTTSQAAGVAPLKDSPLALGEEILDDAVHPGRGKPGGEHLPYGLAL